ncbi:ABC transporter permease [Occallatibacter savannae]|uniref:ABC transporter permease n=1 Tax=Occallatibacter savannae TaxID=1002691 RepID=UPI000D68B1A1|nr:ABC transporter permease [Occallatibacter savannae]
MTILTEVRRAMRQFKLAPMFTAIVVLTLALGIGACTAIFSLIEAVILKSLPVSDPSQLYQIGIGKTCCQTNDLQGDWGLYSFKLYKQIEAAAKPEFDQVAAFQAGPGVLSVRYGTGTDRAQAHALMGEYVSGNYFQTLGVRAAVGRLLIPEDDHRGAPPVAVMSYRTWKQRYGGDPNVVGSTFQIETFAFTIVGIAPPGFYGETLSSNPMDLWVPLSVDYLTDADAPYCDVASLSWLRLIGRLKPDANPANAGQRLTVLLEHWLAGEGAFAAQSAEELSHQVIRLGPAGRGVSEMRDAYGSSLKILLGICCAVLLIGCANVANLLLARGMTRRPQTALQRALGAPTRMILRESFTESLLLAAMGGVLGVIIAWSGAGLIVRLVFRHAPVLPVHISPSLAMLSFCLALSLLTGIIAGVAPAWLASRTDPMVSMRGSTRTMGGGAGFSQKAIVVVQTAVSLLLVAVAGMLAHSIYNLRNQDFGFQAENRYIVTIEPPLAKYTVPDLDRIYRDLNIRLEEIPGVHRASAALNSPMAGYWTQYVIMPGEANPPTDDSHQVGYDRVGPGYFESIGQRLLEGRGILPSDQQDTRQVVVVNQAFVRKFFPDQNPIGRSFQFNPPAPNHSFEIVGVVRDARYADPALPADPMVFAALSQTIPYTDNAKKDGEKWSHFINGVQLWLSGDLGRLEPDIRKVFAQVDPNLAILNIHPLQEQIDVHYDQQRTVADLSFLFGCLAILLASIGLYGVMSYAVARRTGEIGVRMAVGATPADVIRLVLRSAFAQVGIGMVLGLASSFFAGSLLHASLYQVGTVDLAALGFATGILLLSALIASAIPAQRAATLEPTVALRED